MNIGDMLREARVNAGFTQEALALRLGVSRSAIYDWERNKYIPTDAKNIAALESALKFKSGELYEILYGNPPSPSGTETAGPRA